MTIEKPISAGHKQPPHYRHIQNNKNPDCTGNKNIQSVNNLCFTHVQHIPTSKMRKGETS